MLPLEISRIASATVHVRNCAAKLSAPSSESKYYIHMANKLAIHVLCLPRCGDVGNGVCVNVGKEL